MALKVKITQVRSGINRPKDQKLTLRGLGLTKMNRDLPLLARKLAKRMQKIQNLTRRDQQALLRTIDAFLEKRPA